MFSGRRAWIASTLLVASTAAGAWLFVHRGVPWTLSTGDEAEYAEVARRLASGRGFTTGILYPIEVGWGVDDAHPSLLRAPLWPLLLAGVFSATGPADAPVIAAAGVSHVVTSVLVCALGVSLAGFPAGIAAGLAAATSPDVLVFSQFGASETLFGLWMVLAFLLLARRVDAIWVGAACGLAYLTRYNGGLLLVAAFGLLARWPLAPRLSTFEWRPLARCAIGFGAVAAPWWIRNVVVTGSPTYSLYGVTLFFTPELLPPNASLIYMIEPDLASAAAMAPLEKLARLLPDALAHWPLASANLVACAGLFLGAFRRDRPSLAVLGLALVTTVLICTMALRGRYLVPFVPLAIAVAAAAWWRHAGRLAAPALVLMVVAPLVHAFPSPLYDVALAHEYVSERRAGAGSATDPANDVARFAACLSERPLVIAQNAAAVAWAADTLTLHMTRTDADFWQLVGAHPVEYVRLRAGHRLHEDRDFRSRFVRATQCGPGVYRRLADAGSSSGGGVPSMIARIASR